MVKTMSIEPGSRASATRRTRRAWDAPAVWRRGPGSTAWKSAAAGMQGSGASAVLLANGTVGTNDAEGVDVSEFEYGVMRRSGELWRGPMSEGEARKWVREAIEDGFKPGAFVVARREVGSWTPESKPTSQP